MRKPKKKMPYRKVCDTDDDNNIASETCFKQKLGGIKFPRKKISVDAYLYLP